MKFEENINILTIVSSGLSTISYIILILYTIINKSMLRLADKLIIMVCTSDFLNGLL